MALGYGKFLRKQQYGLNLWRYLRICPQIQKLNVAGGLHLRTILPFHIFIARNWFARVQAVG